MEIENILNEIKQSPAKYIGKVDDNFFNELSEKLMEYDSESHVYSYLLNLFTPVSALEKLVIDGLVTELYHIPNHGFVGETIFHRLADELMNLSPAQTINLLEEFTDLSDWNYEMTFSINLYKNEPKFSWGFRDIKKGKFYNPDEASEIILEGFKNKYYKVLESIAPKIKEKVTYTDWCNLLKLSGKDEEEEMFAILQILD